MKRLPSGRYSKEFREEAVKLVKEDGLSVVEACSCLSLPKSTFETLVRAGSKGTLGDIGKGHRPLNDVEFELARVKKDLARVTMERDIHERKSC